MSVQPDTDDLEAVVAQLQKLSRTATRAQVDAVFRPAQSEPFERARERASLVRTLDERIYAFLVADVTGAPSLDALVEAFPTDFERGLKGTWVMTVAARNDLLSIWRSREREWRNWNERLTAEYYRPKTEGPGTTDKPSELEAVYHAAAAIAPQRWIGYFSDRYAAADDRNDFAHCHALLEAVGSQDKFRGSEFSQAYRDRVRWLQSRLTFLEALQKTSTYVERADPDLALQNVLRRETTNPWIFHLHATGGVGKTMLLRWHVARDLVRRRVPCAWVDFDNNLLQYVQHPFRLLCAILEQWGRQMATNVFASAVERLHDAGNDTEWNADTLDKLHTEDLTSVRIADDLVILLDTLEEATLFYLPWVRRSLAEIRRLRQYAPRLTIILAGRYDLERRETLFEPNEAVTYELPRFSREEAIQYLASRRIADPAMQQAIVDRAGAGEPERTAAGTSSGPLLNPFKLALLTDLVVDHGSITPGEIRLLPNVDIAYLIERVIIRIESQPLRWMIRYGAIAREITPTFVAHVLLPPLKEALRGASSDLSTTFPSTEVQKYLDSKVAWKPQPEVAEGLTADALWASLDQYARERGWISRGETDQVLHLHPEVIKPVQMLLSGEPVYRTLHQAAYDFYNGRWQDRTTPRAEVPSAAAEAIYHATMLDSRTGRDLWMRVLAAIPEESKYAIATEPTRSSYRDEEGNPLYPEWLGQAEVESARQRMHQAGTNFLPSGEAALTVSAHVKVARSTPIAIPPLLATLVDVEAQDAGTDRKAPLIEHALESAQSQYDRLWLHIRAADYWSAAGSDDRAAPHWQEAAAASEQAAVVGLSPADLELKLADLYARQRRYTEAMTLYDRVRSAGLAVVATLERQASLALDALDLDRAEQLLNSLRATPSPKKTGILTLRLALKRGDLQAFTAMLAHVQGLAESEEDRVALLTLEAEADRLLMRFGQALSKSFAVTDLSTRLDRTSLLAPPGVPEIELYAFDLGDLRNARQYLEKLATLERKRSVDDEERFQLIRAFLAAREDDRPQASAIVTQLLNSASVVVRARARLVGLCCDLLDDSAGELPKLLETLGAVDPPRGLAEVLSILEWIPTPSRSLSGQFAAISELILSRTEAEASGGGWIPLQLLDLARICQVTPDAALAALRFATLGLPTPDSVARLRYGLRLIEHAVRLKTPRPVRHEELLRGCEAAGASNTPLEGLIKGRTALELADAGNPDRAGALVSEAVAVWDGEPVSTYRTEVRTLLVTTLRDIPVGPPATFKERSKQADETALTLQQLRGLVSLPLAQDSGDLAFRLDKFEVGPLTLRLFTDWREIQNLLVSTIRASIGQRPRASLQIVTTAGAAVLPWEFAVPALGARLMCRGIQGVEAPAPQPPTGKTRVLLIKPSGSGDGGPDFGVSESGSSGFSMEQLYLESGWRDATSTVEASNSEIVQRALETMRPSVIHIIGQLIETPTGVLIDFEGAERRVANIARQSRLPQAQLGMRLEVSALAHYLRGQAPVVILDVTAPENITDALRMMLLRNRFAAELFRSGSVSAVLATGLTDADERESFARALVGGIADNTSLAFLWNSTRDDDEPRDLLELMAHCSSALFAHNPYRRILFTPDGGRHAEA